MTTTFSNVIRGVAFGDAWGDPNEFVTSIGTLVDKDPKGPDIPTYLRITDDTQMSLFLADALADAYDGDLDEHQTKQVIIDAFLDYHDDPDTGSRAPGITVMGSLGNLSRRSDPVRQWTKATNDNSDGSGTVMRTSSAAFLAEDRWVGVTAFAAAVTHGTANGIAAAILNVAVLRDIMAGKVKAPHVVDYALWLASNPDKFGLLETGTWLDDLDVDLTKGFEELARLLRIAQAELPKLTADPWARASDPSAYIGGPRGGGWRAHETLVIALMAVAMLPNDPWDALRRSVTTIGDSDTIGAVTGGLLGAANPGFFIQKWEEFGSRFEPRYIRWIENEADEYEFAPEAAPLSWYRRLAARLVG